MRRLLEKLGLLATRLGFERAEKLFHFFDYLTVALIGFGILNTVVIFLLGFIDMFFGIQNEILTGFFMTTMSLTILFGLISLGLLAVLAKTMDHFDLFPSISLNSPSVDWKKNGF